VIPFDAIRDDDVTTVTLDHFASQDHFRTHVRRLGELYTRDRLARQKVHIEVWCEAAGMIFELAEVAEDYSVRVYSSSGFDSLTAKKDLADRVCQVGRPAEILHLGDHDPSGESIFESAAADVAAFVETDKLWNTVNVRFCRIALTAEQVETWNLPTAPAKVTDTRSRNWSGETCQLEALPPDQIASLLRKAIVQHLNCDSTTPISSRSSVTDSRSPVSSQRLWAELPVQHEQARRLFGAPARLCRIWHRDLPAERGEDTGHHWVH
jgi:hypothetical protein